VSSPSAPLSPLQVNASQPAQFRQIVRQHGADLRVSIPAILTTDIDPVTQTVSVQIAIQERAFASGVNPGAGPASSPSTQPPPKVGPIWVTLVPIDFVPVVIPGGGGFSQTLPLKKGDEGLLVFCDCCFDFWWQNGGVQQQVGNHRHEFWDCGFLPGMRSKPGALAIGDYSTDSMQLRADDGSAYVDVAENAVTISGGTDVDMLAPAVSVGTGSGTPLALVNDTGWQWIVAHLYPWMVTQGYTGAPIPAGSETTVLKAE
jgi:protein gp138